MLLFLFYFFDTLKLKKWPADVWNGVVHGLIKVGEWIIGIQKLLLTLFFLSFSCTFILLFLPFLNRLCLIIIIPGYYFTEGFNEAWQWITECHLQVQFEKTSITLQMKVLLTIIQELGFMLTLLRPFWLLGVNPDLVILK